MNLPSLFFSTSDDFVDFCRVDNTLHYLRWLNLCFNVESLKCVDKLHWWVSPLGLSILACYLSKVGMYLLDLILLQFLIFPTNIARLESVNSITQSTNLGSLLGHNPDSLNVQSFATEAILLASESISKMQKVTPPFLQNPFFLKVIKKKRLCRLPSNFNLSNITDCIYIMF